MATSRLSLPTSLGLTTVKIIPWSFNQNSHSGQIKLHLTVRFLSFLGHGGQVKNDRCAKERQVKIDLIALGGTNFLAEHSLRVKKGQGRFRLRWTGERTQVKERL